MKLAQGWTIFWCSINLVPISDPVKAGDKKGSPEKEDDGEAAVETVDEALGVRLGQPPGGLDIPLQAREEAQHL